MWLVKVQVFIFTSHLHTWQGIGLLYPHYTHTLDDECSFHTSGACKRSWSMFQTFLYNPCSNIWFVGQRLCHLPKKKIETKWNRYFNTFKTIIVSSSIKYFKNYGLKRIDTCVRYINLSSLPHMAKWFWRNHNGDRVN